MTPTCSVVVATYRRPRVLADCLDAVARLEGPNFEVVVVDNTIGDQEVARIARRAGARLVVEPAPGASRARNSGARAARGEVVAFTDDDARPRPDWLRRHAEALAGDPTLSATTGRILPLALDTAAGRAYLAAGAEDLGERAFRLDDSTPGWFERANFGGGGVGPNMVFRRSLFAGGWGFHPALGPGIGLPGEEHYALYTLVRAGHAIAYLPGAVVDHAAPESIEAVDARLRAILRGSAAYAAMLLVEVPGHRRDVLAFLASGLSGRRRAWRRTWGGEAFGGRARRIKAGLRAPAAYAAWRWRFRHVKAPPPPGPLASGAAGR